MGGRYYVVGGYYSFPSKVHYPTSYNELAKLVRSTKKFRIIGSGCTPNDVNESSVLISLEKMNNVICVNKNEITVQSGISFRSLASYLNKINRTLETYPENMNITIGGGIANDVHTSGRNDQKAFISDTLKEVTVMTTKGEIINFKREEILSCNRCRIDNYSKDCFNTVVSGMGLGGIIIEAKFSHVSLFYYKIEYHRIRYIDLPDLLPEIIQTNERCIVQGTIHNDRANDDVLLCTYNKTHKPNIMILTYYKMLAFILDIIRNSLDIFVSPFASYFGTKRFYHPYFSLCPNVELILPFNRAMEKIEATNMLYLEFAIKSNDHCMFDIISDIKKVSTNCCNDSQSTFTLKFTGPHQVGFLNPGFLKHRCNDSECEDEDKDMNVLDPQNNNVCEICDDCDRSRIKRCTVWIGIGSCVDTKTTSFLQDVIKIVKNHKGRFNSGLCMGLGSNQGQKYSVDKKYVISTYGEALRRFLRARKLLDPEGKLMNGKEYI